jgi:hypothetical protein
MSYPRKLQKILKKDFARMGLNTNIVENIKIANIK